MLFYFILLHDRLYFSLFLSFLDVLVTAVLSLGDSVDLPELSVCVHTHIPGMSVPHAVHVPRNPSDAPSRPRRTTRRAPQHGHRLGEGGGREMG